MARLLVCICLALLFQSCIGVYIEGQEAPQHYDENGEPMMMIMSMSGDMPMEPMDNPRDEPTDLKYKGPADHPQDIKYKVEMRHDEPIVRRGGGRVPLPTERGAVNRCPNGLPIVNCLVAPCSVTKCPSGTTCQGNYCGSCTATCVKDGSKGPLKTDRPACKPGHSWNGKASRCSQCAPGYFSPKGLSCRPCPAEYYSQHPACSSCNQCTGETTTFGKTAQTGCGMKTKSG